MTPPVHPILGATESVATALKSVADVSPTFMTTGDKATALRELARAEAQLVELRLRILADAGDVAELTAAHDAAEWRAIAGEANLAQASVIVRSLDDLPVDVPADVVEAAEAELVGHAAAFGPRQLARLGRRPGWRPTSTPSPTHGGPDRG